MDGVVFHFETMNFPFPNLPGACLAASLLVLATDSRAAVLITSGHTDIAPVYSGGVWSWSVTDEYEGVHALDETRFIVAASAQTSAPDIAAYTPLLGLPGQDVWILPQSETDGLPFLGIDASGTGAGVFAGNQITLTLAAVSGPGEVALYQVNGSGDPVSFFNTRDGFDPATDRVTLNSASGHAHFAWAFPEPGEYLLSVVPSATLAAGNAAITGPAVAWNFHVIPEPGSVMLFAVAALGGALRRRR